MSTLFTKILKGEISGRFVWREPDVSAFLTMGPLADGSGALSVIRSDSVDDVRAWFAADPWTVHDVLPVREVQEWTIFLDGRTAPEA